MKQLLLLKRRFTTQNKLPSLLCFFFMEAYKSTKKLPSPSCPTPSLKHLSLNTEDAPLNMCKCIYPARS